MLPGPSYSASGFWVMEGLLGRVCVGRDWVGAPFWTIQLPGMWGEMDKHLRKKKTSEEQDVQHRRK